MRKKILFGSGRMGKQALNYYEPENVYCYVDNNTEKIGMMCDGKKVISFDDLLRIYKEYDIVISCLAYESIAKQLEDAGVTNYEKFVYPVIYDYVPAIKYRAAKDLLSSDRLDVIVKYLYCKDVISGLKNSPSKSLYARAKLTMDGCSEEVSRFSPVTKDGLEAHFEVAESLCKSMRQEKFKKDSFIPIGEDGSLYNGAHRLAAALALDEKVYTAVCGDKCVLKLDFEWFEENGFSVEDKIRILKGFADLYEQCGIFVLFGTVNNHWNYIESQIRKKLKIVGKVDIDLSHNFIAFEILIREMYGVYDYENLISEKISFLKMAPLITRVILVSDEKKISGEENLYDQMTDIKSHIRENLDIDFKIEAFCTLHATSCKSEFDYLKNIILSVNNLKSIEGRVASVYHPEFLKRLKYLKWYCKENDISNEDLCIIGSSSMEVLGIRRANDLDFVVSSNLQSKFPDSKIKVADYVFGVFSENYGRTSNGEEIQNDLLIHNEEYHFWFDGLKFESLELIKNWKAFIAREKDIQDLRLIELYHDFIRNFDDKKILQKQIKIELERRAEQEKHLNFERK